MDLIQPVIEFIRRYGGGVSLAITWAGIAWVYLSKRSDWARKQFLGQVNFSLSFLIDGQLAMRTLVEVPAQNVWLNDLGVRKVRRAAARTTPDQPFVRLDDPEDMDFVYRAVLNVLSEKFADAYLAQSMGLPVESSVYWFAITMERYGDIRTLKLRVLLVREQDLETVFTPNPSEGREVRVPNVLYASRLKTLQAMHDLHRRAGQPGVLKLGRVVLAVRGAGERTGATLAVGS
jgi:hypothetical protein